MQRRVGVVMGGWGEERDISVKTGEAICAALESKGHTAIRILAGPGLGLDRAIRSANIDVAFLALHGRMGEDGKVQGLLEVMGVPYTGSGVLASSLAMNKPYAKRLFRQANLDTPVGYVVDRADIGRAHELHHDLGYPCVVKPAMGGSTIGLTVVRAESELEAAVANACRYGGSALVERFVSGREVTVGILNDRVLGSCEMSFSGEAFDFEHKYKGGTRYHLPPRLSATRVANVEAMALSATRALGVRGYARVDFICSDEQNDYLLEVNTLPGMTQTSLLPKIARAAGMSFDELVEQILSLATLDDVEVAPASAMVPEQVTARHAG